MIVVLIFCFGIIDMVLFVFLYVFFVYFLFFGIFVYVIGFCVDVLMLFKMMDSGVFGLLVEVFVVNFVLFVVFVF